MCTKVSVQYVLLSFYAVVSISMLEWHSVPCKLPPPLHPPPPVFIGLFIPLELFRLSLNVKISVSCALASFNLLRTKCRCQWNPVSLLTHQSPSLCCILSSVWNKQSNPAGTVFLGDTTPLFASLQHVGSERQHTLHTVIESFTIHFCHIFYCNVRWLFF